MTSSLMSAKESRKEGFKESLTNMGGLISEEEAQTLADAAVGEDSATQAKTAEEAEAIADAEDKEE